MTELGIIEGFYGQPWTWEERAVTLRFLADAGFRSYYYAPKADPFIRKKWREPMPLEFEERLRSLIEAVPRVEIGIGFTPYDLHSSFGSDNADLEARIRLFNRIGISRLAILFDDMKGGGIPDLAQRQADITHWIAERSTARHFVMCPTYYSSSPLLDELFGKRPERFLESLGKALDPRIGVIWTGEKICSETYSDAHLRAVAEALGRKLTLWDNYPVNDGPKMCKFLHHKAVEGRPASMSTHLAAHLINPMNQPYLSLIPELTQADSYAQGGRYEPLESFRRCAVTVVSAELAHALEQDIEAFQGRGLDGMSDAEKQEKIARYRRFSGEKFTAQVAREVIAWLEGRYTVGREVFLDQ